MPASLVGVNTQVPNRLVALSIKAGRVPELGGFGTIRREVRAGDHARIDLMLQDGDNRQCFVEVKNCTLVENGVARFPDAVTQRGRKHLQVLQDLVAAGNRAVIFYLVQRMDAGVFRPADRIDSMYGKVLREAVAAGVEIFAYDVDIDLSAIRLARRLPCEL
jgi:sugar fermentation stimulation protein A